MKIATQSLFKKFATSFKDLVRTAGKLMEPRARTIPPNCTNINTLLLHLCDFDQPAYRYALKWLAYPLVNPGVKMQHALVVNGQQGTGSSLFFGTIMGLIHGSQARRIGGHDLTERTFNNWIVGASYVVVEDTLKPKDWACLKSLISTASVMISQKSYAPRVVPNQMNFVHVSSSPDFLPVSVGDRRYMIIEAPPAREAAFYRAVAEEIENGGAEAFKAFLMQRVDLQDFNQFSEPPRPIANARKGCA